MELSQALITLDGWTFLAQICNLIQCSSSKVPAESGQRIDREHKAKADSQIINLAKKACTQAEYKASTAEPAECPRRGQPDRARAATAAAKRS